MEPEPRQPVAWNGDPPKAVHSAEATAFKVVTYAGELDRIAGWAGDMPDAETGGDLFGFWTHSGMPVVQFALGPGAGARHLTDAFFQDTAYLQAVGTRVNATHGLQYIGEWHSHHRFALDRPSPGDRQTVDDVFARHNFDRFLLCIVNLRDEADGWMLWRRRPVCAVVNGFMFVRDSPAPTRGKWVVLQGESPIAQAIRADPSCDLRMPGRVLAWDVDRTTLAAGAGTDDLRRRPSNSELLRAPAGQRYFHELMVGCERLFGPTRLHQQPDGGVILDFEHAGYVLSATFPPRFPNQPVSLIARRGSGRLRWDLADAGGAAESMLATLRNWSYQTVPDMLRNTDADAPRPPPLPDTGETQ